MQKSIDFLIEFYNTTFIFKMVQLMYKLEGISSAANSITAYSLNKTETPISNP